MPSTVLVNATCIWMWKWKGMWNGNHISLPPIFTHQVHSSPGRTVFQAACLVF